MVKVLVTGCLGRMGIRIINMIQNTDGVVLAAAIERPGHTKRGEDVGTLIGLGQLNVPVSDDIEDCVDLCDVMIDFTSPEVSLINLRVAADRDKAIVIGSTGLNTEQMHEAKTICENTRCVLAPNMSVGVNILFKVLSEISPLLKDDYDIEIIEAHHRNKKDAPSGTAIKLAEVIAESIDRNLDTVGVYDRHGIIGARTDAEIGMQTIRGGDIVGDHTVIFAGTGERIEISHKATNRDNFAKGAVKAAKWLSEKENGLYDMMDVLGLKG
ncbi:4-hydroxy-tetrahydrodipicolinate reductase [Thermodesulfobacteriota bacterium]